ncbi:MAG: FkbM family methyltransferase [Segetibacter sp.]|nr:FkbM family methyltransferase [Segetibacter sp.]
MTFSGKIFTFVKTFGALNGFKLYLNTKYQKPSTVKFPFLNYPVHFRGQATSSDRKMFEQIFYAKDYDIPVPVDPKIIIDLGANVGFGSIYFSNRFPNATIFALEPESDNYKMACQNLAPYSNVQIVQGAIWHKRENITVVDKGYGEAAYIIETGTTGNTIPAYTIGGVMEILGADTIDILKIDIEGSEKEIFESGYEKWLPATKILIVETHDRYKKGSSKAVLRTISNYNFSLELSGENLVFYNNDLIKSY